ncbi:MAG: GMC family oxidoreductase [Candidatus Schekmanbacteria bacterium]|nr:GMC family oxidoreductase [Candidatus Schekmanbacteria bacterium]
MIFTAEHITRDLELTADVCVIGSGAGGAPVADAAAAAGLRVAVVEAGRFWRSKDFSQLEHEMFPRLYQDKAGRSTSDKAIHLHQGKGLGGSTLHNLNLCARIPAPVFTEWRQLRGLSGLDAQVMDGLYAEVERRLLVSRLDESNLNANNRILKQGCEALGYRGGFLSHNRVGCLGSGFCELGCPFDAKQNALKVFLTPAVRAGAVVVCDTTAVLLRFQGRRVERLEADVRDPETGDVRHRLTVTAKVFCSSASATGTAALLLRSEVPDPHGLIGSRLHIHPGAAVAGIFDRDLHSWRGIPQSYECTEFLDFAPGSERRVWILPAFAHPVGVSAILAGTGEEHGRLMSAYPRMAAISAMVHDETVGSAAHRGRHGVTVDYWMAPSDRGQLALGLREASRLLFAAGARRVVVPLARTVELSTTAEVDPFFDRFEVQKHDLDITAVHPMGTVWLGDDPVTSCVDPNGRYHHLDNLYVADTSLFPTSIGGPPQLTTYALGTHVGRRIVAATR